MTSRALVGAVVALAVTLGVAALVLDDRAGSEPATAGVAGSVADGPVVPGPPDAPLPTVDHAALVGGVLQAELGDLEPVRLAPGLVPPTNRWFSGLVFGAEPQPVFPLPLSVAVAGAGLSLGLPAPVTSAAAILGPHVPAVTLDAGARSVWVSAYDDASVTVELLDGADAVLGTLVLVQGSPFVSLTARSDLELATDVPFAADATSSAGAGTAYATAEVAGRRWAVVAPQGALDGSGRGLRLAAGRSATWYALPDDATRAAEDALAVAAGDPVTGTAATYGVGEGVARTTIAYRTAGGGATAHVTMPHHRRGEQPERAGCDLGTYPSVYGVLELCTGSRLTSWAPLREPVASLDLSALGSADREAILAQVAADVASTPDVPSDTYFGGKALYRAATLVVLGEQLGAAEVVAPLRAQVTALLREWSEPQGCAERDARCFVYDPVARGVVGLATSFGSEEFNDHHFHYGYLLAAAGLLGADDPSLVTDVAPVMDLLAQDIAAATASPELPRLRVFDAYAGHSWASGTAPFADGNNQESSSEAVNAWNGLGLWAQVSGQAELADQAAWLMSTEAAATAYWTDLDLADPVYDGFEHSVVALNWGGKRDWATWFSAEPSAMLGILLLPMGPYADYLAIDPDRIRDSLAQAAPDGYDVMFGDYLLMYRALAGPQDTAAAWDDALALPAARIDDGSSRAYLLAWIAAHRTG